MLAGCMRPSECQFETPGVDERYKFEHCLTDLVQNLNRNVNRENSDADTRLNISFQPPVQVRVRPQNLVVPLTKSDINLKNARYENSNFIVFVINTIPTY